MEAVRALLSLLARSRASLPRLHLYHALLPRLLLLCGEIFPGASRTRAIFAGARRGRGGAHLGRAREPLLKMWGAGVYVFAGRKRESFFTGKKRELGKTFEGQG